MFENIEKLIEYGYEITIQDVRYGEGFYIAFDVDNRCFRSFAILLDGTYGGDAIAWDYMKALEIIEEKYPDYPFVKAASLEKGFLQINEKIGKWLSYKYSEQTRIIEEIAVIANKLEKAWN